MAERRAKIYAIHIDALVRILSGEDEVDPGAMLSSMFPAGSTGVRASFNSNNDTVEILVHHPTFPEIPEAGVFYHEIMWTRTRENEEKLSETLAKIRQTDELAKRLQIPKKIPPRDPSFYDSFFDEGEAS